MLFIETDVFTQLAAALVDDESLRSLQNLLLEKPDRGPVIAGTGGLRKLRFALPGRGKRGGARVIYYWQNDRERIFLLLIYPKGAKEDLIAKEKVILTQLVKELS
jgi:mRNA-degrading endonuclease RelE of RelBE toxin-antitoxin system